MANLLSLPFEVQRMIFSDIENVYSRYPRLGLLNSNIETPRYLALATICRALLPVIRDCIYQSITVTDRNISQLLRTSRQFSYSNLRNAQTVRFTESSYGHAPDARHCHESAKYLRPISLSVQTKVDATAIERIDVSRLREYRSPLGYTSTGTLLQRASAGLEVLRVYLTLGDDHFTFADDSPPMKALRSLYLSDFSFARAHNVPRGFPRFLQACPNLTTL